MQEYRIVKRRTDNPKWKVVITCQGQPMDYQYKTVFGACVGLMRHYFKKRKYGTMNFSIRQVDNIAMEFKDCCKRFEIKEPISVKYAGSKEGQEMSDVLNNGCWARLKEAFAELESNEQEKSYFKRG